MGFMRMPSATTPFLGMGGGMAGAVASQAAGVAVQEAAQSSVDDAMDASMQMMNAGNSPAQQRKARLTSIFEEKRC